MFPLKDDLPTRSTPAVTVGLIALNVLVFVYQVSLEVGSPGEGARAAQEFVMEFGLVPCRLTGACPAVGDGPSPVFTIFSSMFLHGSFFHIAGNMLYLWIFGNNVEDTLGHGRFILFYLASGVAAAATQTMAGPGSSVPMIGASGAVSGVLGAYFLLFPHANVLTLVIFGFFWRIVSIPALVVLGFWMLVQILGGVAWFAHIGGFVAGMGLLLLLRPKRPARAW
ncbi:MAG: rhomboid family intramembrane serine protease [Candidatus Rokuibacteriota bacterium]|nr:MAG: rhomboid family intramembrane serine protease [Candidatus Rokubacteria bacterium]